MHFKPLLQQSLIWRGLYFTSVLFINVFFSRYLQASLTGQVYYFSNIFAFIQLIAGFSLESALTYYAASGKTDITRLVWFCAAWCFLLSAILTFIAVFIIKTALPYNYKFFAVCYIIGNTLTTYIAALFYARRNFITPNVALFIMNVLFVLMLLCFLATGKKYDEVALDVYFVLFLLQGLVLLTIFLVTYKETGNIMLPSKQQVKQLLRYASVAFAGNFVFFLVYRIDYWFVHNSPVSTNADLGNYIQVSKLGQTLLIIPQIIASAVFPQLASGVDVAAVNNALLSLSRLIIQAALLIVIIFSLFGKQIFTFFFGQTFNKMQVPFLLLMPGMCCLCMLAMYSAFFSAKAKTGINLKGGLFALVFIIIADYFFVPVYGMYAAAITSTIGYAINTVYALWFFNRETNISLTSFFAWKRSDYRWLISLIKLKQHEQ